MNKYILTSFIFFLLYFNCFAQSKIKIGKFNYEKKSKTVIEKVGNDLIMHSQYIQLKIKNKICLEYRHSAKIKDSIFITGKLSFNKNSDTLFVKEFNSSLMYFNYDSSKKVFIQMKNGQFKLSKYFNYMDGNQIFIWKEE